MAEKNEGFMYYVKTIYPLVVIAVVVGLALGLAYTWMAPSIKKTQKNEEKKALSMVLSKAENFVLKTNGNNIYYQGVDSQGKTAGYVFKEGNIGYGGPVVTLIGITNNVVEAIFVLSADQETPGLGYKCTGRTWQKQFSGLPYDRVPKSKTDYAKYGLSAITGATYSSMAVANNIRDAFKSYKELNKGVTNAR